VNYDGLSWAEPDLEAVYMELTGNRVGRGIEAPTRNWRPRPEVSDERDSSRRCGVHGRRKAFLRRRTAVFFTFFFPLIIVVIFGALVQTRPGGGGLFTEPPATTSRAIWPSSCCSRRCRGSGAKLLATGRATGSKLATTPLTRLEWLAAQTLVNVAVIGLAGLLLLALVVVLTGADVVLTVASIGALVAFVTVGVALFCGVGALLGSFADSQDGVIAASNSIALPLLFLSGRSSRRRSCRRGSHTWLSPLTYFSRGVRAVTTSGQTGDAVVPRSSHRRGAGDVRRRAVALPELRLGPSGVVAKCGGTNATASLRHSVTPSRRRSCSDRVLVRRPPRQDRFASEIHGHDALEVRGAGSHRVEHAVDERLRDSGNTASRSRSSPSDAV